ncbi:Fic family protein [Variovorax sp. H27-G14]|uniref:Fic family protein n=1 Tax=Variovorax sp. H27-G14 TaxID=3111914 RepID=UPI0038FCCB01
MILHLIAGGTENHPVYQELQISNNERQYEFLRSAVTAGIEVRKTFLSTHVIKALNYHAIVCLHTNAGEFRPCEVTVGKHTPPPAYLVGALMDDFVNSVNRDWENADPVALAAYVLWRLNHIHPFINGNGRTARAACYFVLCLKLGVLLPGTRILPELISRDRDDYVVALRAADQGDMAPLHAVLIRLLEEQIASAEPPPAPPPRRINRRLLNARLNTKSSNH